MKKHIILLLIIIVFTSCKHSSEDRKSEEKPIQTIIEQISTSSLEVGCYFYSDGKNIINFEILETEGEINGNLIFNLYQKDSNKGTFKGYISEDKLFGIYTFESEGIKSSREVAFMIKDNLLIEGYGELNESGNAFRNKDKIQYTSEMPLKKTDCNE